MAWLAILAYPSHFGWGGVPQKKILRLIASKSSDGPWTKNAKNFLDFLSKMYKKVQKNIFFHFLRILKCYSIELLALSPNPLSDLWGRIPKKSYRPRNIYKKFNFFFARHNVRANKKGTCKYLNWTLFWSQWRLSHALLESIVKSYMACSFPEIYGHEQW